MRAIILAAGRGSRMGSMTDQRPKCLCQLHGKPLLQYQLEALSSAGIDDVAIVTGYRNADLIGFSGTKFYNPRWSQTNMVYSLLQADDWLLGSQCIISYSDIFYSEDAVRRLRLAGSGVNVLYDVNWLSTWKQRFCDPLDDAENFRIDPSGIITKIGGRPDSLESVQGQFMGLINIDTEAWKTIKGFLEDQEQSYIDKVDFTTLFMDLISNDCLEIKGVSYDGPWGEVDTTRDLKLYQSSAGLC